MIMRINNWLEMKKYIIIIITGLTLFLSECIAENPSGGRNEEGNPVTGSVKVLTNDSFRKTIFDYDLNKEWKYKGQGPAIIDFYADWCPPCRQLSPLVEEIAREYSGKIDVYKVDTDKEKILAQNLGITNLPTLLFIPADGDPQITMGALPRESLVKAINEILKIK